VEADKARNAERRSERERGEGLSATTEEGELDATFTFELFVCIAILRTNREALLRAADVADVFTLINGLVGKMHLDTVLKMAEQCFFDYCRKSVTKGSAEDYLLLR
jgi:hypothetical protein